MKNQIASLRKMLSIGMLVAMILVTVSGMFAQTNPTAQALPYTQDFATYTGSTTSYPAGWQGWTVTGSTSTSYPTAAPAANQTQAAGTNASTGGNVYDFNGKIGLLCTASAMKAICLSINTTGKNTITVAYQAATQRTQSADRIGAMALQYRVGNSGSFTTITESEYININTTANTTGTVAINPSNISFVLPTACNNAAEVQLRWLYREVSGAGGRPSFSIDNVSVTGTDIPAPSITASGSISAMSTTEGVASAEQSFTVSGSNLLANLVVTAPSGFEVSASALSGYAASVSLTPVSGTVSSTTLYVRIASTTPAGTGYSGNIAVTSTNATSGSIAIPSSSVVAPSGLSQTLSFGVLPSVTYGDTPLTLNATASSGLAVTYTSSNTSVVTVSGSTLTIVGVGSASVTASQAGNATYNPATDVVRGIIVSPKTLTVGNAAASNKTYNNSNAAVITGTLNGVVGSDNVALNGTGTFASVDVADGIVVTSTSTLTGTAAGNYVLTQPTGLTANITPATATITFIPMGTYSTANSTFNVLATSSSGATVTFTSSNTAVATIAGNVVTIVGAGSTVITASATSTTNYSAPSDATQTLNISSALMAFDFFGMNNVATATPSYVLPGMASAASQPMTRGAGAAGSVGANSFRTVGFLNNGISTANTDYFQWSLTANPGLGLNLTSIDAKYAGTASFYNVSPGVAVQYAYSLDGTNFTLIGSPSAIYSAATVTSHTQPQIDLSGITALQNIQPGTTVTFRYYASGQTITGGWGFISTAAGIHGLVIGGSTFAVPCAFYADVDGDGYGNPAVTQNATCGTTVVGYVELNNTDCNDNAAGVNPGATELACNTIDDNCNGTTDENFVTGCNDPLACNYSATATCATACDYTPQTFYLDADNDTYGTNATTESGCTPSAGYVLAGGDCNDSNNAVNPGATEVLCNNIDDNCNSTTDEGSVSGCMDANASNYNASANCSATCNYTNFTAGNVLVMKLGTGAAALSSAGTPVFVEERSSSALVQTMTIPTTGANRMVVNGSSTAEGQMTRTQDGSAVVFAGYDAAAGTASINGTASATVARVISTLGLNAGTFARQTSSSTHFSAQNFRSATANGTDFWGVGAAGGVNYFGTGTSANVSTSTTNNRVIAVQNGQLYYSTGSGTAGIYAVGTGTPTVAATTSTAVFATGAGSSPYAFQFSADGNTCYVADDRTSAAGGIQKWVKTSGTWSLAYTISVGSAAGARGLAVDFYAGAQPRLYAVINNAAGTGVVYVDDNGTATPTVNTLATATTASNQAYRSIAFAPCTSSTWYADADGDGYGNVSATLSYCTQPYGYVSNATDCDDVAAAINPAAAEICDGIDNDCDNVNENGLTFNQYFADADGDGAGYAPVAYYQSIANEYLNASLDENPIQTFTTGPASVNGFVVTLPLGTCKQNGLTGAQVEIVTVLNGMPEVANVLGSYSVPASAILGAPGCVAGFYGKVDFNFNSLTLQPNSQYGIVLKLNNSTGGAGISWKRSSTPDDVSNPYPGGMIWNQTTMFPGNYMLMNNENLDLNFEIFETSKYTNACSQPTSGYILGNLNNLDCNDLVASINPSATEICDGVDNDCSGAADNGLTFINYYNDADADTYGAGSANNACQSPGASYVTNNTDCNDNASGINPGAVDICNNGIDEDCSGADCVSGLGAAINMTSIAQFGTGSQATYTVNLATGTNTIESPGLGLDKWFKFTASSNALRVSVTGSSVVADDNDITLYNEPTTTGTQLIPIASENDVHVGNQGAAADAGSEILYFDELVAGNVYYICIRNNNNAAGSVTMVTSYLKASASDILPYTNYTGIYSNTCQNFKAAFRTGANQYVVNRWNSADITGTPTWSYAIPSGTICQLGRIVPSNLGTSNQTIYVTVSCTYNVVDAYGNASSVNAAGTVANTFQLAPEADLNLRTTDRCPVYKSATSGSVATNRSVCGTNRYEWSFAQTLPTSALPVEVLGAVGGSRILGMSAIPGIAAGQTYDVQIRSKHFDGASNTSYGTAACVRTLGTAGMPTVEDGGVIAERSENGVTASIYPNPNNGQSVNFAVSGMEGEMNVRIADATGRMVYANRYIVEGSLNTTIDFGQTLAGGVYMVEMIQNGEMKTIRMVVSK